MKATTISYLVILAVVWFPNSSCKKNSDTSSATSGPYFPAVKTIVRNNCLPCHSSGGSWSGKPVAFDSDSSIAAQYISIKAAVNDPATQVNRRMPEGGSLSVSDINTIISWYNNGGKVTD